MESAQWRAAKEERSLHDSTTPTTPTVHRISTEFGGRTLTFETGRLAEQAQGAVLVRYGDTMLLATAVGERNAREHTDFFPLTIDYEERSYAVGRIPGVYQRRESRPSENAILNARLADRPLRPLFPDGYRAEVQVVITVLSVDGENDPDILGIIGASTALMLSGIPFQGPVAAARMGYIDDKLVVNPTNQQLADTRMDIVIAGTETAVMMVEGRVDILPEATVLEAVQAAHAAFQTRDCFAKATGRAGGQATLGVLTPCQGKRCPGRRAYIRR